MSKTERRRTRVNSTIDRLPDDIKGRLDLKLTDTANTYEELSAWLKAEGYEISKSAIGRYAIRSTQAAQRVAETLQRTQAIAQAVDAHPTSTTRRRRRWCSWTASCSASARRRATSRRCRLTRRGGSSPPLARNATYEQRVRQEMKRKAELAFDQMETELLEKVKQYPDLAAQLRDVLAKARERVVADGGD